MSVLAFALYAIIIFLLCLSSLTCTFGFNNHISGTNLVNATIINPANFFIYKDSKLGIKMQYPSNWTILNTTKDSNSAVLFVPLQKAYRDVTLHVSYLSSYSEVSNYISKLRNMSNTIKNFSITKINSPESLRYPYYKLEYTSYKPYLVPGGHIKSMKVLIVKDMTLYDITYDADRSLYTSFIPVFQMMIRSFEIVSN